ncbi:hypothetical protein SNE40_023323 [Patella caerulea]|uniref:Tetratricopeptide repeat protein n=1 Tax=Patella caerulea TaxID=87958 RepID=A0AAN8FY99_PATCE
MDLGVFVERLNFIPSLFTLNIANISTEKLKGIQAKLTRSDEDEYAATEINNLASFLAFLFREFENCIAKNTLVLQCSPTNIQANVMKARLYAQRNRITEAEETFEELKRLSEDDYLMTEANAERAYVLSRMGPVFCKAAIGLFNEVTEKYPEKYEWKYRMALIIRRCQNPCIKYMMPTNDPLANFNLAKELFESVIKGCQDPELRGLSYIGLATLHYRPCAENAKFREMGPEQSTALKKTNEYLVKANDEAPQNSTVLAETGRIYMSMNRLQDAKNVLESSIARKKTSMNCHSLALVLKKLQVENFNQLAIDLLEQSMILSEGTNLAVVADLGKMYRHLSPANYDQALDCFKRLIESHEYMWRRRGNEWAAECYIKIGNVVEANHCKRENIINVAMEYLTESSTGNRQKVSVEQLFRDDRSGTHTYYNFHSSFDQVKRSMHLFNADLSFKNDIEQARSSFDVNDAFKTLIYNYLESKKYYDCLDLATILMVTDIPDIEKVAVGVMMDIVEQTADQKDQTVLVKSCFKRAFDSSYYVEGFNSHVRIIYDATTSAIEADVIQNCLNEIGLDVVQNDEDIFAFQSRNAALTSAISGNVVVICILKNNDENLLTNYPIDAIPRDRPVVIPLVVNDSHVSPILQHLRPMKFPDFNHDSKPKGTWLKEFGNRLFVAQ